MGDVAVLVILIGATVAITATVVGGVYVILAKIAGIEIIVRNGLQLRMTNVESRVDWLVDVAYAAALRDPGAMPDPPPVKITDPDTIETEEVPG